MKFKFKDINFKYIFKATISIAIGTGFGLIVYGLFLYFHIDIYGWNLGLIFAPLAAGYAETIVANRLLGENIGAISAFILFIDTTFYSFILKNPLLGFNLITAGSLVVILQAAFPTLINFLLLVGIGSLLSGFAKHIKKFELNIKYFIKNRTYFWNPENVEIETEALPYFDEDASNQRINSLDFYFITSTDMNDREHEKMGIYNSEVIVKTEVRLININPERREMENLKTLKEGKDECLVKLVENVKSNGGNGILDLTLNYASIGSDGDTIQITAMGIGILIS